MRNGTVLLVINLPSTTITDLMILEALQRMRFDHIKSVEHRELPLNGAGDVRKILDLVDPLNRDDIGAVEVHGLNHIDLVDLVADLAQHRIAVLGRILRDRGSLRNYVEFQVPRTIVHVRIK